MANCPNCSYQFKVEDRHLGTLYTCPSCNAVFFIDWNGQPEMANHADSVNESGEGSQDPFSAQGYVEISSENSENNPQYIQDFDPGFPNSNLDMSNSEGFVESTFESPNADEFVGSNFQSSNVDGFENSSFESPQSEEFVESNVEPSDVDAYSGANFESPVIEEFQGANFETSQQDSPYDFNQPLGSIPQPHESEVPSDPSNLSDIADFGNSNELSSGLSYTISIEGIESFAIVKELKDAMLDSKFGWDVEGLLAGIEGGRLVLRRLSPIKASILVGRIKYLPIVISWKQEVLGG